MVWRLSGVLHHTPWGLWAFFPSNSSLSLLAQTAYTPSPIKLTTHKHRYTAFQSGQAYVMIAHLIGCFWSASFSAETSSPSSCQDSHYHVCLIKQLWPHHTHHIRSAINLPRIISLVSMQSMQHRVTVHCRLRRGVFIEYLKWLSRTQRIIICCNIVV